MKIIPDDSWTIVRKIVVENAYEKGRASCTVEVVPYESKRAESGGTG